MLETGKDGGKCYGKAKGEADPSTLGKTTSLKQTAVVVVIEQYCTVLLSCCVVKN